MNIDDIVASSLVAFKSTIASQVSEIHVALEKEYENVKSRQRKAKSLSDRIDLFCESQRHPLTNPISADHSDDILTLNVGGKVIAIQKSVIKSDQLEFLYYLFSNRWSNILPRDRDGLIFLDMDPAWIRPVLTSILRQSIFKSESIPQLH